MYNPLGAEAAAIIRISKTGDTIAVSGSESEALRFALELQNRFQESLHLIDVGYNFDLNVQDYSSVEDMKAAISVSGAWVVFVGRRLCRLPHR
jgi:hypothetical protein